MHHDECVCKFMHRCSEMRRHDIDDASERSRLTDYLSKVGTAMYWMGNRDKIYYDDIMNTKGYHDGICR